ncbi:MAG: hypothetical protein AAGF74_00320 [Pseudomonadota bacterium]
MDVNVAALTMLCLGFSAGFLFVLNFIERPILPLMSAPERAAEHEDDIRGVHAFLAAFIAHGGPNLLLPFLVAATGFSIWQTTLRGYDVASLFVMVGLITLLGVLIVIVTPAARSVRDTGAYEETLDDVSTTLFRLVRVHHNAFLAILPLTLAQLVVLFV